MIVKTFHDSEVLSGGGFYCTRLYLEIEITPYEHSFIEIRDPFGHTFSFEELPLEDQCAIESMIARYQSDMGQWMGFIA